LTVIRFSSVGDATGSAFVLARHSWSRLLLPRSSLPGS
jgi:hypothetical protein